MRVRYADAHGAQGDSGDDWRRWRRWKRLMTTIPCILNDGNKLSIGDETKLKSLTENLMQKTEGRWDEAKRCRGDSVDSLICAYESFIQMREIHSARLSPGDRLGRRLETIGIWRRLNFWRRVAMTIPGIPNDGNNASIDDEAKEGIRSRS
jgi:hypothetical protein